MPIVRWMRDFLELRPVFTLQVVQVVWWLYVLERLFSTNWHLMRLYTSRGPVPPIYNWFDFAFTPIRLLVSLATVRLLLEVLLAVVMPASRQFPRYRSLGFEFLAFLDLRPFFTRWWLQLFWWLYLLTFLKAVYPIFAFNPPWSFAASFANWSQFFHSLLNALIWLVAIRLLIEAALSLQAPRAGEPVNPHSGSGAKP